MRRATQFLALLSLALAWGSDEASADACAAVCERPEDVRACNQQRPIWGIRESAGVCRAGGFGYLESREGAHAERLRLAKVHKRRCEDAGQSDDCARFEALDQADVVCLACAPSAPLPPVSAGAARGTAPPCKPDEWLQVGEPGQPSRCFAEFPGLPPRIALQGKCTDGDCRSGVGTLKWPGGESYVGSFTKGMRHGQGTFSWPDGRMYVGEWREGQPGGLGTRIFANGRYKAGYFDRGRYLGPNASRALEAGAAKSRTSKRAPNAPSCEEVCTEDAELRLGRINDEFECCFARHAFCTQKAEIALEGCKTRSCARQAGLQREDCDLRYACDAVQTEKVARFRKGRAECVEACTSGGLDDQGLRVSERGTLLDE